MMGKYVSDAREVATKGKVVNLGGYSFEDNASKSLVSLNSYDVTEFSGTMPYSFSRPESVIQTDNYILFICTLASSYPASAPIFKRFNKVTKQFDGELVPTSYNWSVIIKVQSQIARK